MDKYEAEVKALRKKISYGNADENQKTINISVEYPRDPNFTFKTRLKKFNLDEKRAMNIKIGKGFNITAPQGIKKDIKNQDGIFSSRYGSNSIIDAESFTGRYRCKCGLKRGSINKGEYCDSCKTIVNYVDDDVSIVGYLTLKDYYWIIHPAYYSELESFIGPERLNRIIDPNIKININGNEEIDVIPVKKDEPFRGIGLLSFYERYDEILEFYYAKYPHKTAQYNDLKWNKKDVWTHTISVYSSLLRPSHLDNGSLKYEDCNDEFNILAKLVHECNNDSLEINKKVKERLSLLYDIQYNLNKIYLKIIDIMAKKKGDIRASIGGRYSFSSRSVIVQDVDLKADEVRLPFHGLCELMQQLIINILVRSYHFTYADAYKKWYKAQVRGYDKVVYDIIDGFIKDSGGLSVLINRNPTIAYGGILSVKCVGINMNYTMSISVLSLKPLAADFDGDTLNILYLYNKDIVELCDRNISPRNMFISKNDGLCNEDFLHSRDVMINANSLKSLYRYSQNQIDKIKWLQTIE